MENPGIKTTGSEEPGGGNKTGNDEESDNMDYREERHKEKFCIPDFMPEEDHSRKPPERPEECGNEQGAF